MSSKRLTFLAFGFKLILAMLALFSLLGFSQDTAKAQEEFVLHLKQAAGVQGDRVQLGEIVRPGTGVSQEKWLQLRGIELWEAPEAGRRISLGPNRLKRLLRKYLGSLAQRCLVRERLVLKKGVQVLDKEQIRNRMSSYLDEHTSSWDGEKKYRKQRLPDYLFLPQGGEIQFEPSRDLEPGRNSLRIQVLDSQGKRQEQKNATVFVDLWQEVPCADRPLNRKQELTPEDIAFEKKNLAQHTYNVWDAKGGPWRLTRSIGKGRVIYKRYLEPVPLISEGEKVSLVFAGDMVKLRVPARALQDAGAGETVLVKNLQSQERVHARVENSKTVIVQ
ncbi:MAG: flagellar basal body P-ring formation chaperone FlgA [Thermodesulfobacteriota bacterium]